MKFIPNLFTYVEGFLRLLLSENYCCYQLNYFFLKVTPIIIFGYNL